MIITLPVAITVKTGLTFVQANALVTKLRGKFDSLVYYHTGEGEGKYTVRCVLKEIDQLPQSERRIEC